MSDVWHACGNCGGRFPCEASDERDETIASLRAVVREYLAADAALSLARETHDRARLSGAAMTRVRASSAEARDATLRREAARRALVAIDGGAS